MFGIDSGAIVVIHRGTLLKLIFSCKMGYDWVMKGIKKEKILSVRMSADDWTKLQKISKSTGQTASSVIRSSVGKVKVKNRMDEHSRNVALNRINANLNMIARWVNTYHGGVEAVEVVAHLIAVERAIEELAK